MSNVTDILLESSLINNDSQYQLWAVIVMNSLLLLERVFKNAKVFCKCTKDGCTITNRTPPITPAQSPGASQAIEKHRRGDPNDQVDMAEVIRALEKLKESHETLTASLSSRNAISEESLSEYIEWKKRKKLKRSYDVRSSSEYP